MRPSDPVFVELPGWRDPIELLEHARSMPRACLLWSGAGGAGLARFSILSADPYLTVAWSAGRARVEGPDGREDVEAADPFALLASLLARHPSRGLPPWPFAGGAVGCFSYDAARALERLPVLAAADRLHPEMDFALYGWAISWDHAARRWGALATGAPATTEPDRTRRARDACERAAAWASGAPGLPPAVVPAEEAAAPLRLCASLDREGYLRAVRAIQTRIAEGDCYEVNLSRRLTARGSPDPRRLFRALASASPAPFAAYVETSAGAIAGSSPERFLHVSGDRVRTRPIKGTSPRSRDAALDREAAVSLLGSAKDRAENVMIVDLARHDLGRVCVPGSVDVDSLCGLESYSGVHHLVSSVEGRLRPGLGALDAARALFPPGSMTGAPKIRAMEIIEGLEPVRRGPYAGAAGYVAASGEADLCVVIRSLVLSAEGIDLQTGGAVVADSDPEGEFEEAVLKGERALAALREAWGRGIDPPS